MAEKKEFLTYKGKPLVRQGNTIYYGDMADDYVIMMQILAKKEVGDKDKAEVASKVSVQLLSTDPNASMKERIIKNEREKRFICGNGHCRNLAAKSTRTRIRKSAVPRNRYSALFFSF